MTPVLIIKTANGYAVVPYMGEMPSVDMTKVQFALNLTGGYRGPGVSDLLESHFTQPAVSLAEAA